MRKQQSIIICLILICIQISVYGENIQFSSILGQSQSNKNAGLPFITSVGIAYDKEADQLWTGSQNTLYALSRKYGSWQCSRKITLPSPIYNKFSLLNDGENIFFVGNDHVLYAVNLTSNQIAPLFQIEKSIIALAVAPASLHNGFAEKAKWFLLDADKIEGRDANGSNPKLILELTKENIRDWKYRSIGIDPVNGDLLIGSHWPHMTVYRYNLRGPVISYGWPRIAHARFLQSAGGSVWAVDGLADLMSLKKHQKNMPDTIGPYWSTSISGIAYRKNEYILSTTQGLIQFDRYGQPLKQRVGGISDVCAIAVANDGTVITAINNGRIIRLSIDDKPDTAFLCDGNEPFRVGANWSSRCVDVEHYGTQFIVLDYIKKQVWSFDPQRAAVWREKPWNALTKIDSFKNPRSIAAGDRLCWVLDGNQVVELNLNKTPATKQIVSLDTEEIQDITGIQSDKLLLIAEKNRIMSYKRSQDGLFQKLWENMPEEFQVFELVANEQYTVAFDCKNQKILVINTESGKPLCLFSGKNVFQDKSTRMTTISLHNQWIIVADAKNYQLIRLEISP